MKLAELQAKFVHYDLGVANSNVGRTMPDGLVQWGGFPQQLIRTVGTLPESQGVEFLCPKCFAANGNSDVGTHWVGVTFRDRGATDEQGSHGTDGTPTRWAVSGNDLQDLVITPSIALLGGCAWHGFVGSSGVPPGEAL